MLLKVGFFLLLTALASQASIIYSNEPPAKPGDPAYAFSANGAASLGSEVQLNCGVGATQCNVTQVQVLLESWALPQTADETGFNVNVTLTLNYVGAGASEGASIATVTQAILAPTRPVASGGCPNGGYVVGTTCYNDQGFYALINMPTGGVNVPLNTILNVSVDQTGQGAQIYAGLSKTLPSVGSNPQAGIFVNGALDPSFAPYALAYQVLGGAAASTPPAGTPEPATIFLAGSAFALLYFLRRMRVRK